MGMDGTERLCRELYKRPPIPGDYLGGASAIMLHDAATTIAALTAERDALRAATRKVVEALQMHMDWIGAPPTGRESFDSLREDAWKLGRVALADPLIRSLRRE
jgi:hypothetical protein